MPAISLIQVRHYEKGINFGVIGFTGFGSGGLPERGGY
ncbi:hypothetical protein vfu_A01414 [Vibrio furnissii NCTC 11218]|nr:hypothetical protein vfu_A01414 [Vibrio furnissii NCTC 11218]